jgi:hypothetical protein
MSGFDPYAPGAVMHLTRTGEPGGHGRPPPGMTEAEAGNLRKLHANPIWKLAWKLGMPKADGGRGLGPNNGVTVALAEAEKRAAEGDRGWAQALADWRAWRFEP